MLKLPPIWPSWQVSGLNWLLCGYNLSSWCNIAARECFRLVSERPRDSGQSLRGVSGLVTHSGFASVLVVVLVSVRAAATESDFRLVCPWARSFNTVGARSAGVSFVAT